MDPLVKAETALIGTEIAALYSSPSAVHPLTGETVELATAPDGDLARFLADVREYESRLREAKKLASREILRRMDGNAKWSMSAGGYSLKAASPAPAEEWDAKRLWFALDDLQLDGLISPEAAAAAAETEVTYKVHRVGVNALRKLGGDVAARVNECATPAEPKERYVSVSSVSAGVGRA